MHMALAEEGMPSVAGRRVFITGKPSHFALFSDQGPCGADLAVFDEFSGVREVLLTPGAGGDVPTPAVRLWCWFWRWLLSLPVVRKSVPAPGADAGLSHPCSTLRCWLIRWLLSLACAQEVLPAPGADGGVSTLAGILGTGFAMVSQVYRTLWKSSPAPFSRWSCVHPLQALSVLVFRWL